MKFNKNDLISTKPRVRMVVSDLITARDANEMGVVITKIDKLENPLGYIICDPTYPSDEWFIREDYILETYTKKD